MGERLSIRLEVYLPFRGRRMWRGLEEVAAGTTLGGLLTGLALPESDLATLLNGRYRPPDILLAEGDEVAILRQSEGG
ncbi:MAG: hypothetical protein K0R39_4114 [Symbiobacteriaceae bacterium]|jgi:sulfur carrier protein ThiS|nr:hypothetical protein [Symbiobacteriaceae bacterium]